MLTSWPDNADSLAGLLRQPEAALYKADRRSRVWRVESHHGPVVIKRFEYWPLRQRLGALPGALLGLHPAQRERRWNRRLQDLGVPVVPILGHGADATGRRYLIFPYVGLSLHGLIRSGGEPAVRAAALRSAAELTARLIAAGLNNRDHKASNILIDSDGRAYLIDVGAVHRRARGALESMLASMDESLGRAGAAAEEREAFAAAVRAAQARA